MTERESQLAEIRALERDRAEERAYFADKERELEAWIERLTNRLQQLEKKYLQLLERRVGITND